MKDFRTFYAPLVVVPSTLFLLTVWLAQGMWEAAALPIIGLIVAGVGLWYGFVDRKQLLAAKDEEQRTALSNRIFLSYGKGFLWLLGGLVLASILAMDPPWTAILGLIAGFVHARCSITPPPPKAKEDGHVRGRRLKTSEEAGDIARGLLAPQQPTILWGGVPIREDAATTHFCVSGVTGSGKTLTLRLLMQQVLAKIGRVPDTRAIIYDAKGDMPSLLAGMNLPAKVRLFKPFDARGVAWDIAADVTDLAPAQTIAAILFPKGEHESQPYFTEAPQHLLTYLMLCFARLAPGRWTLRDLILATQPRHLRRILQHVPEAWHSVESHFEARELSSLYTTIASKFARIEPVAAAWHHATERLSLSSWCKESSILVLDRGAELEDPVKAINQIIVRRLSQLLISQTEEPTRRTWVFLDEFQGAGELEGLDKLLTEGRSKGVCVVLGFQDTNALKEAYGEHLPNTLTGMCHHKAFLRIDDPETGEWASKCLGEQERDEKRATASHGWSATGGDNTSQGTNIERVTRRIITPTQLAEIPPANFHDGLSGCYISPAYGAWTHTYPGPDLAETLLAANRQAMPDFIPRNAPQTIPPWTDEDLERLGLAFLREASHPVTAKAGDNGQAAASKNSLWQMGRLSSPPE